MEKSVWISLPFVVICFTTLAFVLSYGFAQEILSPMTLGVGLTVLIGCLSVVVGLRLRKGAMISSKNEPALSSKKGSSVRILQGAVVALPLMLVLGLWLTSGGPLIPRLTGAAINIFFTCWFVSLLRRAKKNGS